MLDPTSDLRAHFGIELAARLLRSESLEDRLQGIELAGTLGTNDALSLLARAVESSGAARSDPRALIATARALAGYAGQGDARGALLGILSSSTGGQARTAAAPSAEGRGDDAAEQQGRIELARGIAAMALVSGARRAETAAPDARAVELLVAVAKGSATGQPLAENALIAAPPASLSALGALGSLSPTMILLATDLGDLRTLDAIRAAARSGDASVRSAALAAMAEMGDARSVDVARAAVKDADPAVRAAAVRLLLSIGAPERMRAVEALIADDSTAMAGAGLAEIEADEGVVKALAARAIASGSPTLRRAMVSALGRSTSATSVEALLHFASDPILAGDAAAAIGRTPSGRGRDAVGTLLGGTGAVRRLGARAYVVRALVRDEPDGRAEDVLVRMSASGDPIDRATGMAALVALGKRDVGAGLRDPDPRVRRAVAIASLAAPERAATSSLLLSRMAVETDAPTRQTLAVGLLDFDPEGRVTTLALIDRAESGGPDAPLAAMVLARRADEAQRPKVDLLFASRDPLLRAHIALGLAGNPAKDVIGRLASAYAYEPDAAVRRAVVLAVATRSEATAAPQRRGTLLLASKLDPDRLVRTMATRALAGLPADVGRSPLRELAWLRLAKADGAAPAATATGAVVRPDGLAVPVAFDDDGYALVPTPPGEARLVLAPELPAYEAVRP